MFRICLSIVVLFVCLAVPSRGSAADWRPDDATKAYVWQAPLAKFDQEAYASGVESLVRAYEQQIGRTLAPGETGRVGLKIYTMSGPGLMTPKPLILAVRDALVKRGFEPGNVFIIDQMRRNLQECGLIGWTDGDDPSWEGMPVYALDTGAYYDEAWYYENNLPSRNRVAAAFANPDVGMFSTREERRSYLPMPLLECDLWISLPMATDSRSLGVSGALANASIWAVSNFKRFLDSPANAPVAAVEIAAIPELRNRWAFSILTLQGYQFTGQFRYDAIHTRSEHRMWLSANPVALDFLIWRKINYERRVADFPANDEPPPLFNYGASKSINLGPYQLDDLQLVEVR